MRKVKRCYLVADYETTIGDQKLEPSERETEVWLSCFVDVIHRKDRSKYIVNTSIRDFFISLVNYCNQESDQYNEFTVFFHNLKFDGSFIINFLMSNGFEFSTFINDMGVWYNIEIQMEGYTIIFRDSLKVLNFSIAKMAKLFNTPEAKGETPLLEFKPDNIKPEWKDYIIIDAEILAHGIYAMYFDEKFEKFTSASEALLEFKRTINYRQTFPLLDDDIDAYLRKAYRGGWAFVNPVFKDRIIDQAIEVYDINSMYPSTMLNYPMPCGYPVFMRANQRGGISSPKYMFVVI